MAKWAAGLAAEDWPGCDAAFAWSFYSQGTREQAAASSDLFLKEALNFFATGSDEEVKEINAFAASPAGAYEKAQRLARLVGQRRSLLILDGLEPLQYPPTAAAFRPGELKDHGIAKLLKDLAAASHGLCIVTTRYSVSDLKAFWQTPAPEVKLLRLSREAGVHLLKAHGVHGSDRKNIPPDGGKEMLSEFEKLVEDVDGHALTLHIMGAFLKKAFRGDIRQRDRVTFEEASQKTDDAGHAFRAMAAYEKWMEDGSDEAKRELAILRLMGLFDRPATADCLQALLQAPVIPGLTAPLVGLAEEDWNLSLDSLESARLLTVNRDAFKSLVSLDAHPLLREYFAVRVRNRFGEENIEATSETTTLAWHAAHRRLYEHLCKHQEGDRPTLEDLQPLYQAVRHGCHANCSNEAFNLIYRPRIWRKNFYSTSTLGAFGTEVSTLACFHEMNVKHPLEQLSDSNRPLVKRATGYSLRSLGRSREAPAWIEEAAIIYAGLGDWLGASVAYGIVAVICQTLGELRKAEHYARLGLNFARVSDKPAQVRDKLGILGEVLHMMGQHETAEARFREAESTPCPELDASDEYETLLPYYWLYRLSAFQMHANPDRIPEIRAQCEQVMESVKQQARTKIATALIAFDLGLSYLLDPQSAPLTTGRQHLDDAITLLHCLARYDILPRVLLARAQLRYRNGACTGPESAQADLDEAWEIAERGPMKLFLADIHLCRAKLFGRKNDEGRMTKYPWESPAADLTAAEKLINECGYHHRNDELANAKGEFLRMNG